MVLGHYAGLMSHPPPGLKNRIFFDAEWSLLDEALDKLTVFLELQEEWAEGAQN